MLELAEQGRVGVAAEGEDVKKGRLVVRDPTPTGDAVLDQALQRCSERSGKKPQDALSRIAKGLRVDLLDKTRRAEHPARGEGPHPGHLSDHPLAGGRFAARGRDPRGSLGDRGRRCCDPSGPDCRQRCGDDSGYHVVGRLERRLTGLLKRMPPAQAGKAAVVAVGGDPLAP